MLMVVIFLSGMIVGVGGTLIFIRQQVQHGIQHPEEAPQRLANRVRRVLGLDEMQRDKIEELIRTRQTALQSIRREFQPQFLQEFDELGEEIGEVLNEEQRAEWQEWYGQLRERWIPPLPAVDEQAESE